MYITNIYIYIIYIIYIYIYIYLYIYIGGKHSINHRTTFFPNPHLEEAQLGLI